MAKPTLGEFAWRVYDALPEHYREDDEAAVGDFPLARYVSLFASADDVAALARRFRETQDLVDPDLADVGWLPWLAQLVGVRLGDELTEAQRRAAVTDAASGWRAGTKSAVADAAKTELTGTKFAQVHDHSTDVSAIGAAGAFDVLIVTRGTETPDPAAVLAAVVARGAKPAGVVLYHRTHDTTWTAIETAYPTWTALQATGSWDVIQETGL